LDLYNYNEIDTHYQLFKLTEIKTKLNP